MNTINLIIGGVDVSKYVLAEGYTVQLVQKKSENSNFTNYDGRSVSKILGYYYEISASLLLVPDELSQALAAAISADKFNADFTDPFGKGNAIFLRDGNASFVVSAEVDEGLLWDIDISLKSELINSGGGL